MGMKVLVVGASSGVGLEVTKTLLAGGDKYDVSALVRNQVSATEALGDAASRVSFLRGDVTDPQSLRAACADKDAVVCTIGARGGWCLPWANQASPHAVDFEGVRNLAAAAAAQKVARFVLVSSTHVTRPFSFPHILLNTIKGRVMTWKVKGEESVREAYSKAEGLAYFIVRPGGLQNAAGGQHGLTVGQGDKVFGTIARADVARVIEACLGRSVREGNVTFEVINNKGEGPPASIGDLLRDLSPDSSR
eukprot:jgi/Mesen1/3954/ME000209S02966